MSKKAKLPTDVNSRAKAIVDLATSDEDDASDAPDPQAVARGARGGKARAERLTPEERSAIAKKAAEGRSDFKRLSSISSSASSASCRTYRERHDIPKGFGVEYAETHG